MPLADKEPRLPATMCCSITDAVLKGIDIGIFSLNEVQYWSEQFLCVSLLLIGKKSFFKWKLM